MQKYDFHITLEAINDMADMSDYVEAQFGVERANEARTEIGAQLKLIHEFPFAWADTEIPYRGYSIRKKVISPSLILYTINETLNSIIILRILRQETNWKFIMLRDQIYHYSDGSNIED